MKRRVFVLGMGLCAMMLIGCAQTKVAIGPGNTNTSGDAGVTEGEPAYSDVPDALDAPADAAHTGLRSGVTAVTVYSDRARVTREADAGVTTESKVFAFKNLPGWVDDGSVRVAASAGRIVDVRVERHFLAKATDENWQRAEREHKAIVNHLGALSDELAVLAAQKNQIESIKAFSLDKITKDTVIGNIKVESYAQVVEFIGDALRKNAKARRKVQLQIDEVSPKFAASQHRLDEMKNLGQLEETTVLVTLQASQPTKSRVSLTYMMPGATWEPMHELRVSTSDDKTVEVISYAAVTQTSGEDWGNAELSFSTQSTVESVRIPELEQLTLGDTMTATRILKRKMSSFSRAQKAFKEQSHLWNEIQQRSVGKESVNFEQVYRDNMEYLQVAQSKTVQIFKSLQNRGTTAHFKAKSAHSVRGDGYPTRLRIGKSSLKSTQKIVAVPEQSLNAARTLPMANNTGQAFLPGKVALYQDGAFLGMTEMEFIAKGEQFSLFLSVADHIKLNRELDRKYSTLIQRKRNRMRVAFNVTVENLSEKSTTFTLTDRIPISENREVRIDSVKITGDTKPDKKGLLNWSVKLKPKEKKKFRIAYQVEYPKELILDARRRRMQNQSMPNPAAPAAAPVERKKYHIEDQLMDLEELL